MSGVNECNSSSPALAWLNCGFTVKMNPWALTESAVCPQDEVNDLETRRSGSNTMSEPFPVREVSKAGWVGSPCRFKRRVAENRATSSV